MLWVFHERDGCTDMKITTTLPLAHMGFSHWHTDDTEVGVVVAKAQFDLTADGQCHARPVPDPLALVDVFAGDPATSPLVQDQEIAPAKSKTDLFVRGHARSPKADPRRDWPVTVSVPDVLTYEFQVRGPSVWTHGLRRWSLSAPDKVAVVPLSYALAYGGACTVGDVTTYFEQNPAGTGYMTEEAAKGRDTFPAPQIGLLAEFMDARPFAPMAVHGTMPIAKAWLPRRARAGTFDATWQRDRHPRMPLDYDLGFWNAAHPRLQIAHGLVGGEALVLTGVSHASPTVEIRLPAVRLAVRSTTDPTIDPVQMVLDTVDLDVERIDQGAVTITLLWRVTLADRDQWRHTEIIRG